MVQRLNGLQGLGAPINYYDMIPDFRGEALQETQNRLGQQQVIAAQRENQQAQQDQQRKSQFYTALLNATPDQLPALRRQFPEFAQNIQQEIGIQDAEHAKFVNSALNNLSVASASGDPQQVMQAIQKNAPALASINVSPQDAMQLFQSDPARFNNILTAARFSTMPIDKQFDVQQKQDQLAETIRSNKAGEALTARGQDITAQNARLAANGATSDMKNYATYSQLLKTNPEGAALFAQVAGIKTGGADRQVQLSDGRTVTIKGPLHGAGQNAFYEAIDNAGNTIRVPPTAIAATASSAASAQNYAMKKDLELLSNADPKSLDFLTGVTGGTGKPALGADVRSRIGSGEQRQIFNAAQRIQGKMQNQGIAAARDMGASGINTVAEAKMYFQGMPQVDFSSPEATQQSIRDIKTYTDNYNQQYNVNVGSPKQNATTNAQSPSQPAAGVHVSKSGIQFTVK
jgi:hypothetical protein